MLLFIVRRREWFRAAVRANGSMQARPALAGEILVRRSSLALAIVFPTLLFIWDPTRFGGLLAAQRSSPCAGVVGHLRQFRSGLVSQVAAKAGRR